MDEDKKETIGFNEDLSGQKNLESFEKNNAFPVFNSIVEPMFGKSSLKKGLLFFGVGVFILLGGYYLSFNLDIESFKKIIILVSIAFMLSGFIQIWSNSKYKWVFLLLIALFPLILMFYSLRDNQKLIMDYMPKVIGVLVILIALLIVPSLFRKKDNS